MKLCFVSDDYCAPDERHSRNVVQREFERKIKELRADVEFRAAWLSEITLCCETKSIKILLPDGTDIGGYDVIYPRVFLANPVFVQAFLAAAKTRAYVPFGTVGYQATLYKINSLLRVAEIGIPVPHSVLAASKASSLLHAGKAGLPLIFKILSGYGGAGVIKASVRQEIPALLDAFYALNEPLLIQRFVESKSATTEVHDLRALVIGNEVVCIRRSASSEEFRAGVSTGGKAAEEHTDEHVAEMAIRVAHHLEMDICGVDFIRDSDGKLFFIEANCTPGMLITKTGKQVPNIKTDLIHKTSAHLVSHLPT